MSGTTDTNDEATENGLTPIEDILPQRNTVKHWALYMLDWFDAEHVDGKGDPDEGNPARGGGVAPRALYHFACEQIGEDLFRDETEVSAALSKLRLDVLAVGRRTEATDWDGPDTDFRYRVHDRGRQALLDAGAPGRLPNRQLDSYDRALHAELPHLPGWWMPAEWETSPGPSISEGSRRHQILAAVGELSPVTAPDVTDHLGLSGRASVSSYFLQMFETQLLERREIPGAGPSDATYQYRLSDHGEAVLEELGDPDGDGDGDEWEMAEGE